MRKPSIGEARKSVNVAVFVRIVGEMRSNWLRLGSLIQRNRTETINLHDLFERMSQDELEAYAREGKLPRWFTQTVPATSTDDEETPSD